MVRKGSIRYLVAFVAALAFLCLLVAGTTAIASDAGDPIGPGLPTSEDIIEAIEDGKSQPNLPMATDPSAAEGVPLQDLGRPEVLQVLTGVFAAAVEAPAGIFDDLEVERFLGANVAVIPGEEPPVLVEQGEEEEAAAPSEKPTESQPVTEKDELRAGSPAAMEDESSPPPPEGRPAEVQNAALLNSSVPLRTEAPSGELEPLDLSLEHANGDLQPAASLTEVAIPGNLDEGIELPGVGVTIDVVGAPEQRSPSVVRDTVAAYPNVAEDTDLAVAPTPTGFETLTQIRSADAPRVQEFDLALPEGAALEETGEGGAAVLKGDETLVGISPPTAIDAAGTEVPVELSASGATLVLTVAPDPSAQFPLLLDPLFQTYEWMKPGVKSYQSGICNSSFEFHSFNPCNNREEWGYEHIEKGHSDHISVNNQFWGTDPLYVAQGTPGIFIRTSQDLTVGDRGTILYTVPRYFTDQTSFGVRPTSYIGHLTLSNLLWRAYSSHPSPYLFAGLWNPVSQTWRSYYSHLGQTGHGVTNMAWQYQFPNDTDAGPALVPDTNVKVAQVSIQATETQPTQNTYVYVGSASVELGDKDAPLAPVVDPQAGWVNQTPTPITFIANDAGLGVYAVRATTEGTGTSYEWSAKQGCKGVGDAACPRTWKSSEAAQPPLKYEPALMPTGITYLSVVAEDPVGNKSSTSFAQVKVDHIAPQVSLSGALTEIGTLGTKRPSYTLRASATDGTTENPQSGAAKLWIEMDGAVVAKTEPGCASKNCSLNLEWTLESSKYTAGQHTVKVIAKDGVNLETLKTLTFQLNPSPPTLALSGSTTEQATLGTTRPRYKLKVDAAAEAGLGGAPPAVPVFASSFGSGGTGNGQFAHPGDVALAANGNLWVVDENNNRIQQFTPSGEFLKAIGSTGSGNGQFNRPTAIAIDAKGNLWVADAGNRRIQELNENGEFIRAFGSLGTGNGQFAGGGPEGIAIDAKGNVWVSDTYGARLEQFNEKGEFIRTVGTHGSATGQLIEPTGIDIAPGGNIWVADWANNRVEVYNEAGEYVRQFGSEGTGDGQFKRPDALAIDSKGEVWVGDQNNRRVQQFNLAGEYVSQFGSAGSGDGQFSFGYPMGIAVDTKGSLWVTDTNNNRVQRWTIPNYAPTYSSSFGSTGTGNGQLGHPADVAVDSKGILWVADRDNNRIEKFTANGAFLAKFGTAGSGDGQFRRPAAITVASNGDLLVADAANGRVQRFSASGQFLSSFGTKGSGNGQFGVSILGIVGPEGVAVDEEGDIWVSDTHNGRIQKFNPAGEFLQAIGSKGSAPGQLNQPRGIDFDAEGNLWVADSANNRIALFDPSGNFLRQFGSLGAGDGQLNRPVALDIDAAGNVWVGDSENGRVQVFNPDGTLRLGFGSKGSGSGQFSFSYPFGIAADNKGNLWIADANNNRVQKWTLAVSRSEISTEIRVDGNLVDGGLASCATEHCPDTREWTLDSGTYPGSHTVVVKATDGLGNVTTKSLAINVQADTAKPTLEAAGGLISAPEGWVEQDDYSLNVSARDPGYGVTSVVFKLDGQEVTGSSAGCPDGGCEIGFSKSIDMAPFSGGAHPAELVATDGAGNETTRKWTVNVDPAGQITPSEAEDTLEAVDDTAESSVLTPPAEILEPEQIELGNNPGLVQSGEDIVSTGVPDKTTMTTDLGEGFSIESPEGTTLITPHVNSGADEVAIAEDVAGVAANTRSGVDSVVRPEYNGAQTFQAIRLPSSPHTFSWTVHLWEGQSLVSVNDDFAEVRYEDGHRAFLIVAEGAHDATGATVPTSLEVDGEVLTLIVHTDAASFVYPIIAGTGWETSYIPPLIVEGPEDELEIKEREEAENEDESYGPPPASGYFTEAEAQQVLASGNVGDEVIPAPAPPAGGGASASSIPEKVVKPFRICADLSCGLWWVEIRNPSYHYKRNANNRLTAYWQPGTQVHAESWRPWYYFPELEAHTCGAGFNVPMQVWGGEGKHLTTWGRFQIVATAFAYWGDVFDFDERLILKIWVWPNGFQQRVKGHWEVTQEWIENGGGCVL